MFSSEQKLNSYQYVIIKILLLLTSDHNNPVGSDAESFDEKSISPRSGGQYGGVGGRKLLKVQVTASHGE